MVAAVVAAAAAATFFRRDRAPVLGLHRLVAPALSPVMGGQDSR